MAQQGCCSPPPRTLPVLRTPASHAPPPSPPHRPLGGGNGLSTGCVPSPKACTPAGMESHRWASLQQQGTWMGTGEGTPQEPTCAPSPRSQRRGRRAGTRRLGDGGAPCPPGIPSALLTTAPAGHSRSARILQNWPSRSRTPRLGTRWWLWSSSVLPLGLGASGLREREGLPIPGGGAQGEGGAYTGMDPEEGRGQCGWGQVWAGFGT